MSKVNWSRWASIAEIVSSVAILVTIAYLAVQTKQNTDAINSQSRQSLTDSFVSEQALWLQYPELSVFIADKELEMTFKEKARLDSILLLALSRREHAWREHQAGVLDNNVWSHEVEIIDLILGADRSRSWWNEFGKFSFSSDFVVKVDEIIKDKPLHPYWIGLKAW